MKKRYILLALFAFVFQVLAPATGLAFETRRVVLVGPAGAAQYQGQEVNRIITDSLKRTFRYPFYEVTAELRNQAKIPDRAMLERLAQEYGADIVVATGFIYLRDITYSRGFWDVETWQEIDLRLQVSTYETAKGHFQSFAVKRFQSVPLSVDSGIEPLMRDVMDEVLAKIPFKRVPSEQR